MATTLSVGDIAIVQYNTSTDTFSFVFLRDVEAGTVVNFTDNGWLAAGGFRAGENTVTYTAPSVITAGAIVTLSGLALDVAGDQIIAYQGDPATPTILYVADFADGNNSVAGDATNDNTTALPPGFTLGVNAVAVAFDTSLYAGPTSGSPDGLFAALTNSANWLEGDSLPAPLIFNAKPTIDLDSNNSTETGSDYRASVTSGGPAVPVADADVVVSDDDDTDIFAAEFRIVGVDVRDLLTINGTLPDGIVTTLYRAPDGILRLEGRASPADYEAAIRQVEFSTTDSPGDLKKIQVSVYDGHSWSKNGTAFIEITSNLIAAPPALDLDANDTTGSGADATATYTAGGPVISVTDSDVLITNDGTTIESATITILGFSLNEGDMLSVAGTLPVGITASSYNPFTGIITLSGPASLADYQTALRQVVYSSTLAAPSTADRTIQVTVNDGALESNVATMFMHVAIPPPNLAPVLNLDADSSTTPGTNYLTVFTEGALPVAIVDIDVLAFDSDSPNLASATITLTNPQAGDHLTFDGTPPAGILVSGSGTNVIRLTGVAFNDSYELALRQIRYSNNSVDPSNVTRTIEVVVSDGTSDSNTATAIVQVEAVNNSAPVIDLDPNDSSASVRTTFRTIFTENGLPIPIADTDTTITDLDSPTLVFATITLANRQAGDLLIVTQTLPGGISASAYDPGTGVLTLTGTATLDDYEVALQRVLYGSTSEDPGTDDRLIEVLVNDGVNTSNVAAALITVVAVNDAPALHLDTAAAYVENAAPTALSPLATLTDIDDASLNEVVVRITGGTISGDGDTLTVGGLTDGTVDGITFHWIAAEHAMVLTGASSVANYQALLRTIAYHSTSDNPTDFNAVAARTLTWVVSDGTAVTTATTTLNIVAVNDAPLATVAAAASYTENGTPVVLSPASTATDVDNITLVSGEVRIASGAVDGDLLTVNGLQNGTFAGIDFSYDAVVHHLTFTGPTTVADYQAFLQAVAFSSTSDNPTDSGLNPTRTLSWFVSDFGAFSAIQTTVVSITAAPDPPVNTVPGAQVVNEDTTLPIAGVSVADVDSTALTTTLSVVHGALTATGTGVSGSGTATLTIAGTAAEINAALGTLSYRGNLNFNGADTLTVTTSDGALNDTDTVAITVNAVNDPPVNTVPGLLSVNEDTTLPIAGVSVTDVDSTALTATLSVVNGTLNVATGGGATIGGNGTGTVTISGTATQINSALAGLGYRGNLNFNGADTLTVTTSDGSLSDTDTVAITVNAVSDPPVNTVPGAQSVAEDTTLPIAGVSVTDVDSSALTATLSVVNGTLNVATGGGATIGGNGSGTVTISGTAAQINSALAALSYRGNLNFTGADTLTVTTSDGALNDTDTVPITVNAVNDPPVNTVPGAQSVAEDTTLPIAGVSVADVDSTALTTTLTVTNGTLTVATGGGALITGSSTNSVVINGTATQINNALATLQYHGNLNFNGADTLTVTTSDGSSSDIDTVPITVNAVNDPPVNTVPGAQSVAEDTTLPIAGVSVADVDSTALMTTLSVTNGTLTVTTGGGAVIAGNGSATVTISGTATQINSALAGLSYLGNLDFNGSDTLTVATSDDSLSDTDVVGIAVGTAGDPPVNTVPLAQSGNEDTALPIAGVSVADVDSTVLTTTLSVAHGVLTATGAGVSGSGTATVTITGSATQINAALAGLSYLGNLNFNGPDTLTVSTSDGALTDTDTVGITVNAVSDAPVNTVPGAQSVNEDTPLLITGVSVADVDSTALTATLTVTHGTLTATGTGISGSGTATLTITGTQVSAALGTLSYLGDPNFHGSDTLTVVTSDGSLSDTDTVPITVQAVNDAPVNTVPLAQTVDEDTVLPIAGLSVADVDSSVLLTTLSVVHGTLTAIGPVGGARLSGSGTATMSIAGTAAQINAALATLGYLGNPDFNGSDTLTVTTSDGASNDTDTVAITVNAVNDLPVNTVPGPLSVNEDTTLPISVSVADVDGTTLTTTLTVASGTLTVTTGGGATIGGNGTNSVVINGTAAQINSALAGLSYRGNLDFNGADTLTVTTSDGSSSDTDTVAITVNPVDDAPVNTVPGAQIANEDTLLPIAGVSVADTDSPSLVTTLTVAHGTLTATGTGISGSGTATLTITGTGTQVSAALGTLSYLGSLNFNGADTLTVTTSDGSSSDIDTVPITVNAVNDPPVNTVPGARSVNEDTPLPIGGVSVADVDSPSLVTTLTVAHGTLSATGAGVAGSGTATLTISGSATQINTALGTLSYHGNPDFNGPDTLTVSTSDGTVADTDTVAITVQAVDDPPVNTVPGAQSVNEDSTLAIGGVSVADVDSATLTTILNVVSGILTVGAGGVVSNNGSGTVTISGSAAQINASLATLSYHGRLNFNGADTLTVATSDGTLTDADAVAITVNAVNDRPVLDLDADNSSGAAGVDYTATFVEGGAAVAIADGDDLIADVDNTNLAAATITLANHQPDDALSVLGTLPTGITASAYDPATGMLTLTGAATLAAYESALRQIAFGNSGPTPSAGDRIINIVVNDGAAGSPAAHAFVHVVPLDTAPALDLDANNSSGAVGADYTAVFTGGGAAVPIADADTLIADADSSNIVAAMIALTNAQANDFLAANGDLPTGIAGAFDPATGIFTLTGSAPLADYQAALRQIEFGSTAPNPLTATRIIEVTVNDGSGNSNAALSLIQIAVSAPPTLDLDADDSTASGSDYATIFTEGGPPVPLADTDIVFSAPPIVSATITLTNPFPGDLLTVIGELPEGITFDYDPVTFVLTLNGPGTAADFESVSDQVVYTNSDPNPSTDPRIITVVANDGTSDSNIATAIVHFAGTNDPPSLSVAPAASYTENAAAVVVSPDVTISDPDDPTLTIGIAAITEGLTPGDVLTVGGLRSGLIGSLAFDWAPTLNELVVTGSGTAADYEALFQSVRFHSDSDDPTNGGADTTRTVSWAVFDGATTTIATTTLTLTGVNDAPVNNIPAIQEVEANTATALVGLSVSDPDAGAGTLTTTLSVTNGMLTVSAGGAAVAGSGTGTVTLTGTLAQINTTLATGNVIYRGAHDFFGTDMLTVTTNDGGNSGAGGALTDTDQVTLNLNTHLTGTPNDDNFTALPGNERIDALGSIDTITFGFRLVDATVTYDGNMVIIDGPGSHTVLTGFETYVFTDGTVNNNDGNWLVDDLFYYSRYHDVWNAHAEADDHYDTFGWHEGRDPSFFFSTTIYLSANPDVAAAGVNPIDHWHEFGWTEGRVPSLNFGPQQYLAAYPDVAAAHVDPLEHFLQFGAGELREPFPSGTLVAPNSFDYVYYLQHNPDVAAAHVDPFAHYMTVGWTEGRNPNALFDTNGYLATYADVAAANINPLDHYHQHGWNEGRDPSVGFDTTAYLAAYPDVAAADVNPLAHFLHFGIYEGRSPFADGVWG